MSGMYRCIIDNDMRKILAKTPGSAALARALQETPGPEFVIEVFDPDGGYHRYHAVLTIAVTPE